MNFLQLFAFAYLVYVAAGAPVGGSIDISIFTPTIPSLQTGKLVSAFNPKNDTRKAWELGDCFAQPPKLGRNAINQQSSKWLNNVVPYVIVGNFTSSELANINTAFNQYAQSTCIRFIPRTTESDYVKITNDNTGCWSWVGKIGGPQVLNLQSYGCAYSPGTPAHEMMHALGFFHEHVRPDRDTYVFINVTNIDPNQYSNNFVKKTTSEALTFGLPYEYGSVMHYSRFAFSLNGQATVVTLQPGAVIGQRDGLSALDSQKINAFYNCAAPTTTTTPSPITTPATTPTTPSPTTPAGVTESFETTTPAGVTAPFETTTPAGVTAPFETTTPAGTPAPFETTPATTPATTTATTPATTTATTPATTTATTPPTTTATTPTTTTPTTTPTTSPTTTRPTATTPSRPTFKTCSYKRRVRS